MDFQHYQIVDNILDGVTKVTIQASGASDTNATISAYVGTSKIGETKTLTSTNKTYTFTSSTGMRGNVKFVIKQSSSTAIYTSALVVASLHSIVIFNIPFTISIVD